MLNELICSNFYSVGKGVLFILLEFEILLFESNFLRLGIFNEGRRLFMLVWFVLVKD